MGDVYVQHAVTAPNPLPLHAHTHTLRGSLAPHPFEFCMSVAIPNIQREGGALPVIMSITGPRESHDYRDYPTITSGCRV